MVKWIWDAVFFVMSRLRFLRPSRCKICDLPLVSASVLARAFRSDKWDTDEWETISRGLQLTTSNKKHGTRNILFHHGSGVGCRACWQCFFLGVVFPHFLAAFFLEWKRILLSPTMVSLILEVNRFLTLSAISNFLERQLLMKATQRPVNWCTTGAWCPCRHFYLCIQAHTHTHNWHSISYPFSAETLERHRTLCAGRMFRKTKKPFLPSNSGGVCFTHRECTVRDIVEVPWPFSFEVVYPCSLIPTNGKIRQRWSTFTLQRLPTDFLFRWVLDYDFSPTLPACLNLTVYPFLSSVLTPLSTLHSAWYSVLPSFLSKWGTLCRSCQQIFCEAGAFWSVCEWHKWIWKRAFWQWWMSVDCLECSGHLPLRLAMTSFIKCFDNARGSHSQELSCSN